MTSRSPLKAKPLRYPGQSLDEEIQRLLDDKFLPAYWVAGALVVVAAAEWFSYIKNAPRQPYTWTVVALIAALYCTWLFFDVRKRARRLRLGRDGERAVGQFLEGLRTNGARIFHDILGDDFNIDHVVIAPQGIYLVETKTISKPYPDARVTIEGEEIRTAGRVLDRDPIQQVRAQATWLERVLAESTGKRLPVKGAIVFPGWFVEPLRGGARLDVWILEPKALPAFIEREPERLPLSDVALAAYHLSRFARGHQGS